MIPAERAHLFVAASTHPGMSGKNNEDRFAVLAFRVSGEKPRSAVFATVADGIGGHRAGEVAAEIAVETMSRIVSRSDGTQPIEALRQAIQQASQNIYAQSQGDLNKHGMGATAACALVIEDRLYVAYVGDSRIYLLRNGEIQQVSIDHTWIQEALDAGVISADQINSHPNAHVIRRYLGSPQPVDVDTRLRLSTGESGEQMMANQGIALQPGDQVLLCSDGLTDLVDSDEIRERLQSNPGAEQPQALKALTDLANQRGGHDNITIIALQMPSGVAELAPTIPIALRRQAKPSRLRTMAGCLTALVLGAIVLAALAAAYWLYQARVTPTPTATLPRATTTAVSTPVTPASTLRLPTATPTPGTATPQSLGTTGTTGAGQTPTVTLTYIPTNTRPPTSTPTPTHTLTHTPTIPTPVITP